ncbi:hypothetical protein LTR84_011717 [Exophiala bonariae]|uniref:CST complex subunit Ten1 n=1 Tax=Exophiala bonariae TaxID=1690606 RepID=A0AAV9NH68_9EURO|nr:hypothetical protein LTR84_011717 [Exophiala bonariae]
MSSATNPPAPSRFIHVSEIPPLPSGTKVRCLGCVVQYDITTGRLLLEQTFPKTFHSKHQVWVDVNLVLETIDAQVLCPGAWVNVIGYTRNHGSRSDNKNTAEQGSGKGMALQAILIWSAGALRVEDYTSIVEEQRLVQKQFRAHRNTMEKR